MRLSIGSRYRKFIYAFPHFSDNAHGFEEETGTATVQTGALTEQIVDFRRVTAAVGNTTNTQ